MRWPSKWTFVIFVAFVLISSPEHKFWKQTKDKNLRSFDQRVGGSLLIVQLHHFLLYSQRSLGSSNVKNHMRDAIGNWLLTRLSICSSALTTYQKTLLPWTLYEEITCSYKYLFCSGSGRSKIKRRTDSIERWDKMKNIAVAQSFLFFAESWIRLKLLFLAKEDLGVN